MSPTEFAAGVRRVVLEVDLNLCKRDLEDANPKKSHWPRTRKFYQSLDDRGRRELIAAIRQANIDTTSSILSILDGVTGLNGYSDTFRLTYGNDTKPLNGDLHDIFLESIE